MNPASCSKGMVVAAHPFTARAGIEALRAGGNAFDAAVAAAFTEAVVEPGHNGLAGYGGCLAAFCARRNEVVCLDYNTRAPAAARPDMFPVEDLPDGGYRIPGSRHRIGPLSVGVPAIVDGLRETLECWGTLPLEAVLAPGIRAAGEGFPVNRATAANLASHGEQIRAEFPDTAALLMPDGSPPAEGARMSFPDLATTLRDLASAGLRDFYEGELATRIARGIQDAGGILTREDMAAYRARRCPPVVVDLRGGRLHTPPVGAGGVTSLQILRVLDGFSLQRRSSPDAAFFHLFAEVLKACWRRRLTELGDTPDVAQVMARHLSEEVIREIAAEVRAGLEAPQPGEMLGEDPSRCTSHICAADREGNVVSLTQTHGAQFGSWFSIPGTGLILGHGMARFDPRPGWPNSIAPGKAPLHNMAPLLITRQSRPWCAIGTPGGRTIVSNQAYFAHCLLRWRLDPAATLAAPRLHVESCEPLQLEERAGPELFAALESLGHQVKSVDRNGGAAHAILLDDSGGFFEGATDPRYQGEVAWK
jgi:gamma-glutamyltranspeptidase/glutathione hydrolase